MLRRSVVWVAGIGLLAGCVTVPEFRALEREIAALKRDRSGTGAISEGDSRLADLGIELSELRDELAQLRGEIEDVRHIAQAAGAAPRTDPGSVSESAAGPQPASPAAPAGRVQPDEPPLGETSAEVRSYEEAFRLYRAAEYRAAIDRFRAFLQTHASSDYADNAQFWLGECYFKIGEHEQAVLAFDDVVKRFPGGNKVPDALYRQGVALLAIGRQTENESEYIPAARQIFEKILSEHPDSERVPEARRQLEKLGT